MDQHELIDYQYARAESYARQFSFRHFQIPDPNRLKLLRINIFEYMRKRDLKLDYHEIKSSPEQYCFTCLAYLPKFHFCIK